jgi:ribosome biogenesis GTPase
MPIGIVSVVFGARCEVLEDGKPLPCLLRGKLKLAAMSLAVGDHVEYRRLDDRTVVVERILERRNQLSRSSRERPRRRGGGPPPEQVVLANPDQVVFVAAARNPGISFQLLDRALALARGAQLPAAICVNKVDLVPVEEISHLMQPYERLGIPIVYASAEDRQGLEHLEPLLKDRLSFFWGGSGVGKSSLIRALTGADLKVGYWRTDNPRGPHTTNVTRLYPLPFGGLIADTPGFDWLELDTVDTGPDRIETMLPEALPFQGACRFPGCTHCGEAGCAVMAAVLSGDLDRSRYARFRGAVAEAEPPPHHPTELITEGQEFFFRMREGTLLTWATFELFYLFQPFRPERQGLLTTLGVPPDAGEPGWVVFQETPAPASARTVLTGKLTSRIAPDQIVRPAEEVILRERGVVKGIGRFRDVLPVPTTWPLRKALKGTPVYDGAAFWTDLKPPRGEPMGHVHAAFFQLGDLVRFENIPSLALGAVTRQETGLVLDFLEVGASEDELDKV